MSRVWVKVCGITTRDAAEAAVESGADALGFVFLASPRQTDIRSAAEISEGLDVERVALLEGDATKAMQTLESVGATGVQPYGPTAATIGARAAADGYLVLRPVAVRGPVDLDELPPDHLPLLDRHDSQRPGGTGRTFDWDQARGVDRPFVLAGGLGPDNVAGAIGRLRPWGVDASSRLESRPGVKDPSLVRAFVTTAKQEVT